MSGPHAHVFRLMPCNGPCRKREWKGGPSHFCMTCECGATTDGV